MTEITKQNCAHLGLPDYFKVIQNKGMSLPTIRRKLKEDPTYSFAHFCDDVNLMVENAMTYNHKGEAVYNLALDLKGRFDTMLAASSVETPVRTGAPTGAAETGQTQSSSKKRGRTPPLN
jgi:hypothetical protein